MIKERNTFTDYRNAVILAMGKCTAIWIHRELTGQKKSLRTTKKEADSPDYLVELSTFRLQA